MMRLRLSLPVLVVTLLVTGVILLTGSAAFAQQLEHATVAKDFAGVQKNLGVTSAGIPRLIALLGYVAGTFFAISGLLKMKAWMDDPDRNPLNAFIFRIVVATLLIFMPHMYILVTGTLFGSRADGGMSVNQQSYVKEGGLQPFTKSQ